ncbi:MAG TPA: ABC transporter substrate-binding protein [Candidatus Binatia bacterium]
MNRTTAAWLITIVILPFVHLAHAQQAKKVARIGLLVPGSQSAFSVRIDAFRQGLRELGYLEGQNIVIEYRYGEGKTERLPELAGELVRLKVDVIVTASTLSVQAAKKTSGTVPVIFTAVNDPVGTGLVASFARPGGNVTGMTNLSTELDGKRLELLKETFPKVIRVAYLCNPNSPKSEMQAAAQALGVQLQTLEVRSANDFNPAFEAVLKARAQAIIISPSPVFITYQKQIVDFAAKNRLPAVYTTGDYVIGGGLMSYAHNNLENWRRAATYVDKILKGAKPAELPVELPTSVELVVNMKTATALDIKIPQSVLARADRVIE